jgi:hypothetical protein
MRLYLLAAGVIGSSLVAGCAPGPESPTAARAVPGAAAVTPISGISPFPPGCAAQPMQPFGERLEDAEVESSLAVNPRNPANLVVAWMQDLYAGLVTATSSDGGRHWTVVPVPGTSRCSGGEFDLAADPVVAFGAGGTAYLAGFSLDLAAKETSVPTRTRMFATTSTNGGREWAPLVEVTGGYGTLHDMPTLATDPVRPCTAYLAWTDEYTAFGPASVGLMFARTDDCGRSWSAPVTVFAPNFTPMPFSVTVGSKLLAMQDGSLTIVTTALSSLLAVSNPELPAFGPESLVAFRSTDGGMTWSAARHVAEFVNGPFHDPETGQRVLALPFILSAAVAPDGTAYVTWRQHLAEGVADIRLVRSDDHGVSWSEPIVVRASGTQMMIPTLATAADGTIAVTYYDIRNDALADPALSTDLWVSQSSDRGVVWKETHVAGPFDLRQAARRLIPAEGLMVGDYAGLVAVPDGFAASFVLAGEPATAGASDIFFARIRKQSRD